MSRNIRSIPPVEVSASSDVPAPVFHFRDFVRSPQDPDYYRNNGRDIDFVTSNGSLYVPTRDHVVPCADNIEDDGQFLLIVKKGPQGEPGIKGDPGKNGRTPAVFARFDGRQMIFYTEKVDENGEIVRDPETGKPVTVRIAATNDLTGPSWKPKLVDETIVWEKTRDDEAPKSINLHDLVIQSDPVIFRVDSDNTKRTDETSGPANYIQWKYEGDEYWNNLISISELMNLTLAGVSIWFNEDDQRWHFGHREVEHAYYDSTPTGKRIITDVELGEVLYDAGPLPESNYDLEIYQLGQDICDLKNRVEDIEEELPKFVKSVEGNRPDENGDVKLPGFVKSVEVNGEIHLPDENGKVELPDYYTKEESDNKYLTPDDLDFELVKDDNGIKLYVTIAGVRKEVGYTCDCKGHEPTPTTVPVTGVTITNCVNPLKVGQTGTIVWSVSPNNATDKSVTFTSSDISVATVSSTGVVTANAVGSATITVKTTDGEYTDTCNVNVTNDDEPTPSIPDATVYFTWSPGEANAQFIVNGMSTTNHQFTVHGNETITWEVTAEGYHAISNGTGSWKNTGSQTTKYIDIVFEKDTEPEPETYTFTIIPDPSDATVIIEDVTRTSLSGLREGSTVNWSVSKAGYEPRSGSWTMTNANKDLSVTLDPISPTPTTTYTLTINGNGGTVYYKINNGSETRYEQPISVDENASVKLRAGEREGYTLIEWQDVSSDTTRLSPSNNEFTMIKNTSIKIIWEKNTYTVNTSLDTTCGNENKADHIYISKTSNVGTQTSISNLSGRNTIHVKAVKNGYQPKEWSEDVQAATTIKLDSTHGGCTWTPITTPCVTTVDLGRDTLRLTVGETFTFNNPVSTSGDCSTTTATWTSGDDSVATVDNNGKVTGVNPGTTTIIASANGISDTCSVEVIAAPCVVNNITIASKLDLIVDGEDGQLNTVVNSTCDVDYEDVVYNSSNPDVASVNGGVDGKGFVIANSEGTAIVTATYDGVTSNECLVTVGAPTPTEIPITGARFNKNKVTITRTCGTTTTDELTVSPVPADATVTGVSWSIDSQNVATIQIKPNTDNRTVIVTPGQMAGGSTTIRVTITGFDSNGQSTTINASCPVEIVDSMIINAPNLPTASGDNSLYLLKLNAQYQLTTTTPSGNSVNWSIDGSASSSGISVSSTGLVTGTRIGSGIAIATNTTTGCHDNVRFQVYDEEHITINSVEMESDGLDWINGTVCSSVSGNDTGYQLDYLIYAVDSNGSRPTSTSPEQDINPDVAVGTLNENCEDFNIGRDFFGNRQYAYILVRDHFNNSIKDEAWYRIPEPEN